MSNEQPNEMEKDLSKILGYGVEIEVAVGKDGDKVKIEKYHMCPVALRDIPALQKSLNVFMNASQSAEPGKETWKESTVKEAANVVVLSLKKMHPEVTVDDVLDKFGLGGLAKAVKVAMDVNNFLSEMGEIKKGMSEINQTQIPPV
ncbi:MAG: hypothetical protein ACXAC7_07930 [Candidatus Hodarchaeales archaeon]|jgi:hypothetical protein